jgi:glycerol-3-phosphate dehydrogenase
LGTWESTELSEPGDTAVAERDLAAFMSDLNQSFPALDLTLGDVTLIHRGVLPGVQRGNGAALLPQSPIVDHASAGVDGLISVSGAKYTVARAVAERVVDRAVSKLQRSTAACRTAATPLPGGTVRDVGLTIAEARRDHDEGLPSDTIPHLVAAYGSRYRDILELADERPEWRRRVAKDSPVIGAELVHAVRHEMAVTLADAVVRRTPIGALGDPGDEALTLAAAIVGGELGWPDEKRREEIAAVKGIYRSS